MKETKTHEGVALKLPPGDFAAYIFDCDGTLADTMPTHYRAWQLVLGRHAVHFPEKMFYELGGAPAGEIVALMNDRHGLALPVEDTVWRKESIYLQLSTGIAPIGPVVAIARANAGRKPMAVASGGHRNVVLNTLRVVGIVDLFDAIVTVEDYLRGKPAPDAFLEAAHRLGAAPAQCLVFEDTATGAAAAKAAGMQCVLVPPLRR